MAKPKEIDDLKKKVKQAMIKLAQSGTNPGITLIKPTGT